MGVFIAYNWGNLIHTGENGPLSIFIGLYNMLVGEVHSPASFFSFMDRAKNKQHVTLIELSV
jgi:hypothetical protein